MHAHTLAYVHMHLVLGCNGFLGAEAEPVTVSNSQKCLLVFSYNLPWHVICGGTGLWNQDDIVVYFTNH